MATEYEPKNKELTERCIEIFKSEERKESARKVLSRFNYRIMSSIEEHKRMRELNEDINYLYLD